MKRENEPRVLVKAENGVLRRFVSTPLIPAVYKQALEPDCGSSRQNVPWPETMACRFFMFTVSASQNGLSFPRVVGSFEACTEPSPSVSAEGFVSCCTMKGGGRTPVMFNPGFFMLSKPV